MESLLCPSTRKVTQGAKVQRELQVRCAVRTPHDAGHVCLTSALSLCFPRRTADGDTAGSVATIEVGPVSQGPADPPAAARHALTQAPLEPPALRVVTYNILADQYASTDHAQNVLFGYCPTQCAPKACLSLPV